MCSTLNHALNILNAQYLLAVAIHHLSYSPPPASPPPHSCYIIIIIIIIIIINYYFGNFEHILFLNRTFLRNNQAKP